MSSSPNFPRPAGFYKRQFYKVSFNFFDDADENSFIDIGARQDFFFFLTWAVALFMAIYSLVFFSRYFFFDNRKLNTRT